MKNSNFLLFQSFSLFFLCFLVFAKLSEFYRAQIVERGSWIVHFNCRKASELFFASL